MPTKPQPLRKRAKKPTKPRPKRTKAEVAIQRLNERGIDVDTQISLLAHVTEGKSMKSFVAATDGINQANIYAQVRRDKEFAAAHALAREDQADTFGDAISDIAAEVLLGKYDPQAARVAIDALKWSAAKLRPKVWGEKTTIDVTVDGRVSLIDSMLSRAKELDSAEVVDV